MSNIRFVTTLSSSDGGGSNGGSSGGNSSTPTSTSGDPEKGTEGTPTESVTPTTPEPGTKPETETPLKHSFSDIGAKYSWAKSAIEELDAAGIVKGTSETTFEPGKRISRADFILLLVRALELEAKFDTNFDDIAANAYYAEAVGIAKQLGLATGIGGNRFEPKAEISRQDMMVLTTRALRQLGKLNENKAVLNPAYFADTAQVSKYAEKSVAGLVEAGIIEGDGRALHPQAAATRAEVVVMIHRIYMNY